VTACSSPKAKGRPCIERTDGRCLWCSRSLIDVNAHTHCVCGGALVSRRELAEPLELALEAFAQCAIGTTWGAALGSVAVSAYETLRAKMLLTQCARCVERAIAEESLKLIAGQFKA
jgi:hypothetical protein